MTDLYSISTIRKKIRDYGKKIKAPKKLLKIFTTSDGFGTPFVEIDDNGYNYIVSERGIEFKRRITEDIHKLLYWIFESIVFNMASEYELKHRRSGEDFRRLLFNKEVELFEKLDPEWAMWKKDDIKQILMENPFDP
jgi:hypothetical protein